MAFSKFSVFSGAMRDLRPDRPQPGYSFLGQIGRHDDLDEPPAGTFAPDIANGQAPRAYPNGRGSTVRVAENPSSMAATDNEPHRSVTTIPTDPRSLKQAIDDASRANGTPVFRAGTATIGVLDGRLTRTGENEWTLQDGTLGVLDGGQAYGHRYEGFDIIIRQDPQTGEISYESR